MNKGIIIANLKKDHFRIIERYGKFILGAEYETIEKGRCISIEKYHSLDEFISSAKAFIDEMKTVSDSFAEFVNEFFTSSKPEIYDHSSDVIYAFEIETAYFIGTVAKVLLTEIDILTNEYDIMSDINGITDESRKCFKEFKDTESRLDKYINITTEIEKVNNEKDNMSFSDIVKGTTVIMDHLIDVVDEYTLNTFNNEQLGNIKDTCMLQISNSQRLVQLYRTSLDLNEEDEKNINLLKSSAMRLAMMVGQIDLVVG